MKVRLFRNEKYSEKDASSGVVVSKERQTALKGTHWLGGAAAKPVGAGKQSFEDYCEAEGIDAKKADKDALVAANAAWKESAKANTGVAVYDLNEKQVAHAKRHGLKVVVA